MNPKVFLILTMGIVFSSSAKAHRETDSTTHYPLYTNVQYAGNIGLASVGVGTAFFNRHLYLGLAYGYLPKSANGVEVHTIAIGTHYNVLSCRLNKKINTLLYAGTNVNIGFAHNTYLNYPDYFPDNYYQTNAIHLAPYVGSKIDFTLNQPPFKRIGLYAELGTLDRYVGNFFTSKQVSLSDIVNLAIGISLTL